MQVYILYSFCFFFFKQKTAYEMRISDWSSDVCSSDLKGTNPALRHEQHIGAAHNQGRAHYQPGPKLPPAAAAAIHQAPHEWIEEQVSQPDDGKDQPHHREIKTQGVRIEFRQVKDKRQCKSRHGQGRRQARDKKTVYTGPNGKAWGRGKGVQ